MVLTLKLNNNKNNILISKKILKIFLKEKKVYFYKKQHLQKIINLYFINFFYLKYKSFINKQKKIKDFFLKNKKNLIFINYKKFFNKKLDDNAVFSFLKLKNFNYNLFFKKLLTKKSFFYNKLVKKNDKKKHFSAFIMKSFFIKLQGLLLKRGKKTISSKILKTGLLLCSNKMGLSTSLILFKLYNKLKLSTELKKIKIRRSVHFVTFPMTLKRKLYLISSWLIFTSKKNKIKKPLYYKLAAEIAKILKKKKSHSLKKKNYFVYKSVQFRSNNHFRW